MAPLKWKNVNAAAKVVGPIRCHTCRLVCNDAAHYLSHKCGSGGRLSVVRQQSKY